LELEPYLHFDGTCEAALNFYSGVFGGGIEGLNRFAGSPMEHDLPPEHLQRVMHASFRSPSIRFMASDGRPERDGPGGHEISLCLSTTDLAEAERVFSQLGEGGQVTMPFGDTFWGSKFGMVTDRYGIQWMVTVHE